MREAAPPNMPLDLAIAVGPGDEDFITGRRDAEAHRADHAANRFITWNKGITHAGEAGHAARPKQPLVPELMPDHSACTTTSSALAGARSMCLSPRFSGLSRTTATVYMSSPSEPPAAELGRFVRVPVVTLL